MKTTNNVLVILALTVVVAFGTGWFLCENRYEIIIKNESAMAASNMQMAKLAGATAVTLVQKDTWYMVAPGIVKATLDGTSPQIDYQVGITLGFVMNRSVLDRNKGLPQVRFHANTNNSSNTVCNGLLVMEEVR